MTTTRPAIWVIAALIGFSASSCAGGGVRTASDWGYPLQKVYNAGQADVWAAVIQTLPQMGFVIELMDMDLGLIRASDDIRRDLYSFFSGTTYRMEVRVREVAPGATMIFIEYPRIKPLLYDRVNWDPEADIFEYIQLHMGAMGAGAR